MEEMLVESAALLHAILMAAGIALLVVSLCIFIHLMLLLFIAIIIIKLSPSSFVFTFTLDYCFNSNPTVNPAYPYVGYYCYAVCL